MLNPPISSHLASAALEIEAHVLAKGETPSIAHFEEADFELHSPLVRLQAMISSSMLTDGHAIVIENNGGRLPNEEFE